MTNPEAATLGVLADRCEAATGADRRLDREIQLYAVQKGGTGQFRSAAAWLAEAEKYNWNCPHFTASFDAAITLVPEGEQPGGLLRAAISALGERFALHIRLWPRDQSYPACLARFVCAAALRSRIASLAQPTSPPPAIP